MALQYSWKSRYMKKHSNFRHFRWWQKSTAATNPQLSLDTSWWHFSEIFVAKDPKKSYLHLGAQSDLEQSLKWESATHTGPLGPVQAFICLPLRMSAKRGWICVLHPAECTEMKPNKLWGGTWTCHLCSSTQGFVRCLSPMLQDIFKSQNLTLGQCITFYLIVWAIHL